MAWWSVVSEIRIPGPLHIWPQAVPRKMKSARNRPEPGQGNTVPPVGKAPQVSTWCSGFKARDLVALFSPVASWTAVSSQSE